MVLELVELADVSAEGSQVLSSISEHPSFEVVFVDPWSTSEYRVGGTVLSLRSSVKVTELIILKFIGRDLQHGPQPGSDGAAPQGTRG